MKNTSFYLLALMLGAAFAHAKESVTQSNNIMQIRIPRSKVPKGTNAKENYILFSEFGFDKITDYSLEILFEAEEELPPSAPAAAPETQQPQGDAVNEPAAEQAQVDVDPLLAQANLFYNQAKYAESLRAVEEALKLQPNNARAWAQRGSLMYIMGNKAAAQSAWNKSLELDPNNEAIKNQLQRAP